MPNCSLQFLLTALLGSIDIFQAFSFKAVECCGNTVTT